MAAPVPIPDLTLQMSNKADSRATSAGTISPVTIGGLVKGNNWVMLGVVGVIAVSAILIFRGKK